MSKKPTIFSGVQPSGNLHIGNYLGAISQWVEMQNEYNCIFCVVDYHAITVKQDPKELNKKITEIAKLYLASGIDPKKSIIFQQSDIKEHTELAWILTTITKVGELKRMTQFKDKTGILTGLDLSKLKKKLGSEGLSDYLEKKYGSQTNNLTKDVDMGIGAGLMNYPVLMAADILLYNTDIVPVGDDQVQHVELTRTLAKRFNSDYKEETFKVPEVKIRKEGARIMGLDIPEKKMSKSATSELNYIALTDDPAKAKKKIMKATTDSDNKIKYDPKKKPGISNLLTIYSLLENKPIKSIEKKYAKIGYGDFKKDLAEVVADFLNDFQKKYNKISDKEVSAIMKKGADTIRPIAEETVKRVKKVIGI